MAAFVKINDFVQNLGNAEFAALNGSTSLKLAFSNTAPASETSNPTADGNGILANVTAVTKNLDTDTLTSVTWTQSSGTSTLSASDLTVTGSGGSTGPFRYVYLYDDSTTTPADALIGYWDYGSSITIADTETFLFDIGASGILTLA